MTKEEKIKEAYGIYWENVKEFVSMDDGWCSDKYPYTFDLNCPVIKEIEKYSKYLYSDNGEKMTEYFTWIPKSINGIEDNNGWIRIESENNLPKKDGWYEFQKFPLINSYKPNTTFFYANSNFIGSILEFYTHYRDISIIKEPIY